MTAQESPSAKGPVVLEKRLYTAIAHTDNGREGRAKTDDGTLDLPLAQPRALGGSGNGTNPEQLFAAGYAACFGGSIVHIARAEKVQTGPVLVTGKVSIGPVGTVFGLAVVLEVSLPQLPAEQAAELVRKAHELCPYSNATRGNIEVDVRLVESQG